MEDKKADVIYFFPPESLLKMGSTYTRYRACHLQPSSLMLHAPDIQDM